jgi:hypothetical protein
MYVDMRFFCLLFSKIQPSNNITVFLMIIFLSFSVEEGENLACICVVESRS